MLVGTVILFDNSRAVTTHWAWSVKHLVAKSMRRMESIQSDHPLKLASLLADRLRQARRELVQRWLERIEARVTLSGKEGFPTQGPLNHVPLFFVGIDTHLQNPATPLGTAAPVKPQGL